MGLMVQVVHLIALALVVQGSAADDISPSPSVFSEAPAIEKGTPSQAEIEEPIRSYAPSPSSLTNGTVSNPPSVEPPIKSASVPETVETFVPSLSPTTPVVLPSHKSVPPPLIVEKAVPLISPSPQQKAPDNKAPISMPAASGPVLPSSKDLPDNPPLINPERPGLVPPSTNQGKAPDFVAPAHAVSSPRILPQNSPTIQPIMPTEPKPIFPGPDISPTSTPINSRKSDRASLASPPKEMPQPSTDPDISPPVSTPPPIINGRRDTITAAPPKEIPHRTKGSVHGISPSSRKIMRPSINVLPPQLSPNPYLKKGSQSPASPSSTFSYNHRHSKKDITEPPPPAPQQHGLDAPPVPLYTPSSPPKVNTSHHAPAHLKPGSLVSPFHAPLPSSVAHASLAPSPIPPPPSDYSERSSPQIPPSALPPTTPKTSFLPPLQSLQPPPKEGSLVSPSHPPLPSSGTHASLAPSAAPKPPSRNNRMPFLSPQISPSALPPRIPRTSLLPPLRSLPPPPSNEGSLVSPSHPPLPSSGTHASLAPSAAPNPPSHNNRMPFPSRQISPSALPPRIPKSSLLPPLRSLPPPPFNEGTHASRAPSAAPKPASGNHRMPFLSPQISPSALPPTVPKTSVPPPLQPIPPPSSNEGSLASPLPSSGIHASLPPSPAPTPPSGNTRMPFLSPQISPSAVPPTIPKTSLLPPLQSLPPPPPNEDCSSLTCIDPLTNSPPGSPCACVIPMKVGLRLSVALYTFFPLVTQLAEEIASGVFMKQSQVRIMGANAGGEQPEKTIVLIDLVPLGDKFDNTTAFLTYQRFWDKQVAIKYSFFGDYDVLYVQYPGLPASPPMATSGITIVDGGPYSGDNNARTVKPVGVDVTSGRQKKERLSGGVIAVIVLSLSVAVILVITAAWVLLFKNRDSFSVCGHSQNPTSLPPLLRQSGPGGSMVGSEGSSASLSFGSSIATCAAKTFSSSEIEKATDNFNISKIIGEGGFGRVYCGVLEDGTKVAVKVLKRDDQQGGREFLAEVEMLSRLHHRNLVKLIGICVEERNRCLVYELIPNGSVESHLHGVDKESAPLDWCTRMKIALGAARGLAYLHEDSSPRVIHRDFKSSNILLEHDFTPKVSDFGLARTAMDEETRHISTRVMGTFGYVAPEYAMTGHLLVKSDVYSYGVVLLELLTGRKPVDMSQPPGQENLVSWARPLLVSKEGLESIIDPSLEKNFPFDSAAKVAAIASMCVQPEVSHRPFMGEVVQALKLVCNECEDVKEVISKSLSREDLSMDLGTRVSTGSGRLSGPLPAPYPYADPNYDPERGVSVSGLFNTSTGLERQSSWSFRRRSSSGPLRMGRGRQFWQRVRRLSGGSASEHGTRLWPGSR